MGRVEDALVRDGDDSSISANGAETYTLLRDSRASTRLTAQHGLWKELLGFLLHPDVPTSGENLKIADVCTGNGVWLLDLARRIRTPCEFHGFDISMDQVGPKPWQPANVHMHNLDVFKDPPLEFQGIFDIVHIRLIGIVVTNNDPRPVLASLTKLLKPGGYLQWDEVDTISWKVETVPGVSGKSLHALYSQMRELDTSWKYDLARIIGESGYSDTSFHTYPYGLDLARIWSDIYVSTWREFADKRLKTPEASDQLELKAMEEVRQGAALMVPLLMWVARKT
ncbi:hypothetical protein F4861DRAFT_537237 [Xylaria intraflava]|nr:hypothetical protein F4861DRAFT_537237 [Xylaria intraflava]